MILMSTLTVQKGARVSTVIWTVTMTTTAVHMQPAECTIVYENVTAIRAMKVMVKPVHPHIQTAMMSRTPVTHRAGSILSSLRDGLDHTLTYTVI